MTTTTTTFELLGSHQETTCASCHESLKFSDIASISNSDCADCHTDVHSGELSQTCSNCHTEVSFLQVDGLSIHDRTTFPLVGAHVQTTCESCHRNNDIAFETAIDPSCASCHLQDYEDATTVNHADADFPLECQDCHNQFVWNGVIFDHLLTSNGFELLGAHEGLSCANCHTPGAPSSIFGPVTSNDCLACHQSDFEEEHGGNFPTTCLDCHTDETWDDAEFDHLTVSNGFDLVGAHLPLSCENCHIQPGFELIFTAASQNDCVACHQQDYDDEHAGSGFPTTCTNCHDDQDWDGAEFDHLTASNGFDLVGAHLPLSCEN